MNTPPILQASSLPLGADESHATSSQTKDNTDFLGTKIDVTSDNGATHSLTTEHLRQFEERIAAFKSNFEEGIHKTWKDVASVNGDETSDTLSIKSDTTPVDESSMDTLKEDKQQANHIDTRMIDKSFDRASTDTTQQLPEEVEVQNNSSEEIRGIDSHLDTASTQLNTLKSSPKSAEPPKVLREALTSLGTKIENLKTLSGVKQKTALFNLITELNGHLTNPALKNVQPPLQEIQRSLAAAQTSIEEK